MTMRCGHMTMRCGHMTMRYGHMTMRCGHMTIKCSQMTMRCGHMTTEVMSNLALCPRQRLVDDFLLNPEMVLESFLSYGLVEEAVEYAKVGCKCCIDSILHPVWKCTATVLDIIGVGGDVIVW